MKLDRYTLLKRIVIVQNSLQNGKRFAETVLGRNQAPSRRAITKLTPNFEVADCKGGNPLTYVMAV